MLEVEDNTAGDAANEGARMAPEDGTKTRHPFYRGVRSVLGLSAPCSLKRRRAVLPREEPLWLQLPADLLDRVLPPHEVSGAESNCGPVALLPNPAVLVESARPRRMVLTRPRRLAPVLVLGLDGNLRDSRLRHADAALLSVAAAEQLEMIDDDESWSHFPEITGALQELAEKEECFAIAFCRSKGAIGIGVGMGTLCRRAAAKVALAITLAVRHSSDGGNGCCWQNGPFSLRWLVQQAERTQPDRLQQFFCSPRKWLRAIEEACLPAPYRWNWRRQPPRLLVKSPCWGASHMLAEPCHWDGSSCADHWRGFCACCKRPLELHLHEPHVERSERDCKRRRRHGAEAAVGSCSRFAYVVALWGEQPEDVIGALVLGQSLRKAGCQYDMVAMHTFDVPEVSVRLLQRAGWKTQPVKYVHASSRLFATDFNRFACVFTKLRALGLGQYSKILLMDADLLVRRNIDELFDLTAPAAMARGTCNSYKHGERIDGSIFFAGAGHYRPWGQSMGINAGVMLLKPDSETLERCLAEVMDDNHPSHIQGNGPEQDYLSRFYAGEWSHISVEFNFQLHQMYFALGVRDPLKNSDRGPFLQNPDRISIFHYSGHPKPWIRRFAPSAQASAPSSEDEWVRQVQSNFRGFQAWVLRDPEAVEKEAGCRGGAVDEEGRLVFRRNNSSWWADTDEAQEAAVPPAEVFEVPEWAIRGAELATRLALREWENAYEEVGRMLGMPNLALELSAAIQAEAAVLPDYWVSAAAAAPEEEQQQQQQQQQQDDKEKEKKKETEWPERDPHKERWHNNLGWWQDAPSQGRCVVHCTLYPEARACMVMSNELLCEFRGCGLHLAARALGAGQSPPPMSFLEVSDSESAEALRLWVAEVPKGAMIFIAVVGLQRLQARSMLKALAMEGVGCPLDLPEGSLVAAGVGIHNGKVWPDTHASSDCAYACCHVPCPSAPAAAAAAGPGDSTRDAPTASRQTTVA